MKVTGPTAEPPDAAPGPGGTQTAGKVEGARVEGTDQAFTEKLAGVASRGVANSGQPTPPAPVATAARPIDTSRIAAELEAGRLQPQAAIEKVLDQVLAQQLGADAPPAVREIIRAALQDALETDPLLAEKIRRLNA